MNIYFALSEVMTSKRKKKKIKYKKEKYWVYCPSIFYAFLFYFLFEHLWWCGRLKWIVPFSGIKAWRLPKSQSCYTIPVSLKCTALGSVVTFFSFANPLGIQSRYTESRQRETGACMVLTSLLEGSLHWF